MGANNSSQEASPDGPTVPEAAVAPPTPAPTSENVAAATDQKPVSTTPPNDKTPPAVVAPTAAAEKAPKAASPKTAPKKASASPKSSPKTEGKAAGSSPGKTPLPPGEVRQDASSPVGEATKEKKGRGKGKNKDEAKDGKNKKDEPKEKKEKGKGKGKDKENGKGKETKTETEGNGQPSHDAKLCIKNLLETTTSNSLQALFRPYGTVVHADAKVKEDGKCRGFGFVTMSTAEEAKKAMTALNGKKAGDKELAVMIAERRDNGVGGKAEGKGKGKEKGAEKGTGKGEKGTGKDGKSAGKGAGKVATTGGSRVGASSAPPGAMQSAPSAGAAAGAAMSQAGYNPYAANAYMQAYYQQYTPYLQQYYYGYQQQYAAQMAAAQAQQYAAAAAQQQSGYSVPYGGAAAQKEYEGSLKSVSEKHGYGFIFCEETLLLHGRDVYVSRSALPAGAKVLDRLRFTVKLVEKDKKGQNGEHKREDRPTAENVKIVPTAGGTYKSS